MDTSYFVSYGRNQKKRQQSQIWAGIRRGAKRRMAWWFPQRPRGILDSSIRDLAKTGRDCSVSGSAGIITISDQGLARVHSTGLPRCRLARGFVPYSYELPVTITACAVMTGDRQRRSGADAEARRA